MSDQIRLGGFVLDEPISSGGMGTVWRGHHELSGTPVAVKVIAGAHVENPVYLEGFEREVRAVAGMEHPRIVRVYDYGYVDSAAERTSEGELARRSPWLAMELATRGSLAVLPEIGDYQTLAKILFDILDALAHSHARGIVHRDLKPGNVLLTESGAQVVCKLTDFGIAHVSGASLSTREVFASSAGTPWYMAPEQVESRWRDYGPWTDLYALGCVAYQLAAGVTPFRGESVVRVARQQLFDRPPVLAPMFSVPAGFTSWVERLLVKEIPHRFRRAADAAWALHQISPRTSGPLKVPALRTGVSDETSAVITTDAAIDTNLATLTFLSDPAPTVAARPVESFGGPSSFLRFGQPPIPRNWRDATEADDAQLRGAGLGLFRLRGIPLTGREPERDRIWEALRRAVMDQRTRAVVVRGQPGMGKSQLVRWIARRAHELGSATVISARHSPTGGADHGLPAMLSRYLGVGGLDYERAFLRIRRLVTAATTEPPDVVQYYSAAIARFLHPADDAAGVPAVRFTRSAERYQALKQFTAVVADRRALLVVLDDVQWGYDALEYALRLLQLDRPILLLMTVEQDELRGRPLEADTLRSIEAMPNVQSLDLRPMSRREHGDLLDSLLSLEPTLREDVLDRTGDSPLFAAELLAEWVRRAVLRSGPTGFRLDVAEEIPADIHALWNRRVDRVLEQTANARAARVAIEVGAALGTVVSDDEWRTCCEKLGVGIDDGLVDCLVDGGLVDRTPSGWSFAHQLLRQSISAGAAAGGRDNEQHRVVADLWEFDDSPDSQLRRALHFLAVDDWVAAAQPLLRSMEQMIVAGRTREATAVLATLDDVFEQIPADHQLRRRVIQARLVVLRQIGTFDEMVSFIHEMYPIGRQHGWQDLLADLYRAEGGIAVEQGDVERGAALMREAMDHARLSREPGVIAAIHRALGWLAIRYGDSEKARAHFEASRDHHQMAGQPDGVSEAIIGIAEVCRIESEFDEAIRHNDEARRLSRQGGYRILLASHLNQRGDIAAATGDYEAAREFFREALELARLTANQHIYPIAVLNLAVANIYLGETELAAEQLEEAHGILSAAGQVLYTYYCELGMLWCASPSDPTTWDARYEDLLEQAKQDMAERESAEHAIEAGRRWRDAGDHTRARQSFELARRLTPSGFASAFESLIDAELDSL